MHLERRSAIEHLYKLCTSASSLSFQRRISISSTITLQSHNHVHRNPESRNEQCQQEKEKDKESIRHWSRATQPSRIRTFQHPALSQPPRRPPLMIFCCKSAKPTSPVTMWLHMHISPSSSNPLSIQFTRPSGSTKKTLPRLSDSAMPSPMTLFIRI